MMAQCVSLGRRSIQSNSYAKSYTTEDGCIGAMSIYSVPNSGPPPAVHLRESYREDGKVRKRTDLTLEQAIERAASANTKDKLAMSSAAKSNTAWRLVSATGLSKMATADASGVGESTVAAMRRVFAQLTARATPSNDFEVSPGADIRDLSWAEAKRLAAGQDEPDLDRESANEKKAQVMALALRKALGKEGGRYPEIFARASDIFDTRLVSQLIDHWRDSEDDQDAENVEAETSGF